MANPTKKKPTAADKSVRARTEAPPADLPSQWPSSEEQREIADRIDREVSDLDQLAQAAEAGVALLNERRAALISAAVTGEIDVRAPMVEKAQRDAA